MKQQLKSLALALLLLVKFNSNAQTLNSDSIKQKSTLSYEIDPIVPFALHAIGGHLVWKPKTSKHFVFLLALIVKGTMPNAILNLDAKNKNLGWHYKINQGMGIETEYYYKEANKGWFSGIQLFTQEINITNDNVPDVKKHRTNTGTAVITTGYKWYPFKKKKHFYLKPWAGIGYAGIISGAFSKEIIPNTIVGSYEYHIQKFTPFATVHFGYTF